MKQSSILLVEDDENDVYLLQYAFRQAGIENPIIVLTDGQQALNYFTGRGPYADRVRFPLPCLVLLDLKLPLRSGMEVLEWIRSQSSFRGTVVILFTASAQPADVQLGYELGANSFIVKPSDVQSRRDIAEHLRGWWLKHNQFAPICEKFAKGGAVNAV